MKPDNASSGNTSGATSATAPPPQVPAENLTEAEYLAQQAENAKLAMGKALEQLKSRLSQGMAPSALAKQHPWVTVGAAAVAGFFAASTLIPSKEEQALKKLAAIERALHPAPSRPEHVEGNGKKEGPSLVSTIMHEMLAIARPAIISMMTAGIGGAMQAPVDPETSDGKPASDGNPSTGGIPPSAAS